MSPLLPQHLMQKPPVLTPNEVEQVQATFVQEVEQELRILGVHSPEVVRQLLAMRDEVIVTPKLSGVHEARWTDGKTGKLRVRETAEYLMARLAERTRLLAFGPDPVQLLVERLESLGVPAAEARAIAPLRIARLADGRVEVRAPGVPAWTERPARRNTDERLSADEQLAFGDTTAALARAARSILAERERPARRSAPFSPRESVPARLGASGNGPSAPAIDGLRHRVAEAF